MNIKKIHKFLLSAVFPPCKRLENWLFYEDETRDAAIVEISIPQDTFQLNFIPRRSGKISALSFVLLEMFQLTWSRMGTWKVPEQFVFNQNSRFDFLELPLCKERLCARSKASGKMWVKKFFAEILFVFGEVSIINEKTFAQYCAGSLVTESMWVLNAKTYGISMKFWFKLW